MQSQYLAHHGIKGQKWGIRRYQNEDGTLTEAGKKRYGGDVTRVKPEHLRRQYMNAHNAGKVERSSEIGRNELRQGYENWKNSKEYKAYQQALKEYADAGSPVVGQQILIPKEDMQRMETLRWRSNIVLDFEMSKAWTKYTSAVLEDLGYDTSIPNGKQYVLDILDRYGDTHNTVMTEVVKPAME